MSNKNTKLIGKGECIYQSKMKRKSNKNERLQIRCCNTLVWKGDDHYCLIPCFCCISFSVLSIFDILVGKSAKANRNNGKNCHLAAIYAAVVSVAKVFELSKVFESLS